MRNGIVRVYPLPDSAKLLAYLDLCFEQEQKRIGSAILCVFEEYVTTGKVQTFAGVSQERVDRIMRDGVNRKKIPAKYSILLKYKRYEGHPLYDFLETESQDYFRYILEQGIEISDEEYCLDYTELRSAAIAAKQEMEQRMLEEKMMRSMPGMVAVPARTSLTERADSFVTATEQSNVAAAKKREQIRKRQLEEDEEQTKQALASLYSFSAEE